MAISKLPVAPNINTPHTHSLRALPSRRPQVSTMDPKSKRPKYRDATLSSLNAAIRVMDLAKEATKVTQAKAVFGSVGVTLAMIRVGSLLV